MVLSSRAATGPEQQHTVRSVTLRSELFHSTASLPSPHLPTAGLCRPPLIPSVLLLPTALHTRLCAGTVLSALGLLPWPVLYSSVQSCPTFCGPMDCSPPGSSAHGILEARILELPFPPPGVLYSVLFLRTESALSLRASERVSPLGPQ